VSTVGEGKNGCEITYSIVGHILLPLHNLHPSVTISFCEATPQIGPRPPHFEVSTWHKIRHT